MRGRFSLPLLALCIAAIHPAAQAAFPEINALTRIVNMENGNSLRHSGYFLFESRINANDSLGLLDSAFFVRPARTTNAGSNCYSFESRNYPGYFIRHLADGRLKIEQPNGDTSRATFCVKDGDYLEPFDAKGKYLARGATIAPGLDPIQLSSTSAGFVIQSYKLMPTSVAPNTQTPSNCPACSNHASAALVNAGWFTPEQLTWLPHEGAARDTLIVRLSASTNTAVPYLQSKTTDDLVNYAYAYSYLMKEGIGADVIKTLNVDQIIIQRDRVAESRNRYYSVRGVANHRTSVLSEQKKRQIIFDNLPLWALHDAEGYPPKPIQNYIKFDIKEARYIGNSDVNLMPFFDRSHHIVGGSKNHSDSSKHILGKYIAKFSEETSTRDRLFIDPRQAPTYAFYQERENGDIWIRYFLFFGYNNVPNSPVENHFADVVHISVNLRNVDGNYIPAEYFYSAHSDGALRNAENVEIRYFDLEGGDKLNQISFDEAKRRGKFHPLVYLANGTHEAYTQSGYHHILGVDNANFGVLIAPFSNPFAADPHDRNRELVAPVYSWDMTAPKYNFNSDMQLNPATASSAPPVMRNIPSQLSPQFGNEFQDIFFYRHSDGFMYWVVNIGHDENSAEGLGPCHAKVWEPCTPGVSTPPVKVFDWVNFNE